MEMLGTRSRGKAAGGGAVTSGGNFPAGQPAGEPDVESCQNNREIWEIHVQKICKMQLL